MFKILVVVMIVLAVWFVPNRLHEVIDEASHFVNSVRPASLAASQAGLEEISP